MNGSASQFVYKACGGVLPAPRRTEHTVLLRRSGMSDALSMSFSDPETQNRISRRLLANLTRRPETGCWEWQRRRNAKGYGCITVATGTTLLAHRVSYSLFRSDVPRNMMVCHHCDNPSCCNPMHLFIGTRQDNMDDMKRKGRSPAGMASPNSKLTDADVMEIRRRYAAGDRTEDIGATFGIKARNVSWVATGKSWSHLPGAVRPRRLGRRVLSESDIAIIRGMRTRGIPAAEIAIHFGIHESAVHRNLKSKKKG